MRSPSITSDLDCGSRAAAFENGGSAAALHSVVIALGGNLGDRAYNLRRALHELGRVVTLVRISGIHETAPVDAPAGSPRFLNMVVAGHTRLTAEALLDALLAIEAKLGRRRGLVRNAPRAIDLDLILHDATRRHTRALTLPHPRYRGREFVMKPMAEVWVTAFPSFRRPA